MIPLLINTHDKGGAANACIRLHKGLLKQNIKSKLLVKNISINNIPEIYQIAKTIDFSLKSKLSEKIINILKELKLYKLKKDSFINSRTNGLEIYSYPYSSIDITKSQLYKNADIINLHWVANFLDYKSFFKKNNKPIVWTLHDQNPFTGGEHYKEQYLGMDKNGYPIKRKLSLKEKEKHKEIEYFKKEALSNFNNLHIVTLCNWMKKEVKQSCVFSKYNVNVIPNGIDSSIFAPRNKQYSRELLNISQNKKVILFVADSIFNKRKGFEYLKKTFENIKRPDTVLLSVGSKNSSLTKKQNIIELGLINDELLMSIIYSLADVFVIPSIMDNLPNTVLESILCGTPVIGFPVGGITDMIHDGKNGFLCDEISVKSLTETLEKFLENDAIFDRMKIRENAVKKYDLSVQTQKYIELYKKVLIKPL